MPSVAVPLVSCQCNADKLARPRRRTRLRRRCVEPSPVTRPETKHKVIFTSNRPPQLDGDGRGGGVVPELRRAVTSLQDSIDAARSFDHVRLPADGPVSAADVVEYARRISYTTFAPAGYQPVRRCTGSCRRRRRTSTSRRRTSRHTRHRRGRGRRRGGLGRRLRRRRGRRRAEGEMRRSRPSSSCCRRGNPAAVARGDTRAAAGMETGGSAASGRAEAQG